MRIRPPRSVPPAAEFIIFNAQFFVFDTKFLVVNTKCTTFTHVVEQRPCTQNHHFSREESSFSIEESLHVCIKNRTELVLRPVTTNRLSESSLRKGCGAAAPVGENPSAQGLHAPGESHVGGTQVSEVPRGLVWRLRVDLQRVLAAVGVAPET